MKKITLFLFSLFCLYSLNAEDIIQDADEELERANQSAQEQESMETNNTESLYIDKIQKSFFSQNRKGNENTRFITYKKGVSYKIRTRETMVTSIVLENDEIENFINGDEKGFDIVQADKNIIVIKPKIIGADTNLLIVGKSKTTYSLYLFSTNTENRKHPTLLAYIYNPALDTPSPAGGGDITKI